MRDRYSQDEVNEILLRAIERQPTGPEISRAQMESMAAEIGISVEALRNAEEQWALEHVEEDRERSLFSHVQKQSMRSRVVFVAHLSLFLLCALLLMAISMEEEEAFALALALLIPWSVGLVFHASYLRQSVGAGYEKAFRQWQQAYRSNDSVDAPYSARRPRRLP